MSTVPFVPYLFFVALVGLVLYLSLRHRGRDHAWQRAAGRSLLVLGGVALIFGGVFLFNSACVPVMQIELGPDSELSYPSRFTILRMGAAAQSGWFLFGGTAFGTGLLLLMLRFSLRGMLMVLGLVAFLASVPQFMVGPSIYFATITGYMPKPPAETQWKSIESSLSRDGLLNSLSRSQQTTGMPCENLISGVEMRRVRSGSFPDEDGVRLTVCFHNDCSNRDMAAVFLTVTKALKMRIQNEAARAGREECSPEVQ